MGVISLAFVNLSHASDFQCTPTPADAKGPFYKPDAPVRSFVGTGYILTGVVRSAKDCAPITHAKIEYWMAGPQGNYDDAHRGTITTDKSGSYRIESNFPPDYGFRPPHIHLRITAERFLTLISQHYPKRDSKKGAFDIVLKPS